MEVVVEIDVYGLIWVPGKGRWLGFDFLGHSVPKKEVCLITLFLDEYGGGSRVHEYLNGGGLVTEVLDGLDVLVLEGF